MSGSSASYYQQKESHNGMLSDRYNQRDYQPQYHPTSRRSSPKDEEYMDLNTDEAEAGSILISLANHSNRPKTVQEQQNTQNSSSSNNFMSIRNILGDDDQTQQEKPYGGLATTPKLTPPQHVTNNNNNNNNNDVRRYPPAYANPSSQCDTADGRLSMSADSHAMRPLGMAQASPHPQQHYHDTPIPPSSQYPAGAMEGPPHGSKWNTADTHPPPNYPMTYKPTSMPHQRSHTNASNDFSQQYYSMKHTQKMDPVTGLTPHAQQMNGHGWHKRHSPPPHAQRQNLQKHTEEKTKRFEHAQHDIAAFRPMHPMETAPRMAPHTHQAKPQTSSSMAVHHQPLTAFLRNGLPEPILPPQPMLQHRQPYPPAAQPPFPSKSAAALPPHGSSPAVPPFAASISSPLKTQRKP
ncbi:hypothetical protein EC973_006027 [Apophysomyces ossiformis]|uniref:Uncharacterized protein n=1 Tax=Apophysomyces ossiformis TaxID=679940 RepID=A0A8H7BVW9_9FUNG|nr:hypothetical protein EC973_006027 [Apophysomyces ossiformis]